MRRLLAVATLAWLALAGPARAAELAIGFLEIADDPRYAETRLFARYLTGPLGRPYAGAEVALREVKFHGAQAGVTFELRREQAADAAGLVEAVRRLRGAGVGFFILDAAADAVAAVAAATAGQPLLLFNIAARDDALRQGGCQPHLLHVIPSHAMLTDALAQYLGFRQWQQVLLLDGPREADKLLTAAFERSARRYGLEIVDKRAFRLSNDPRERSQNNIALLTAEGDYDVVFVADSDGEFARGLPYQTVLPRPIVGSEGLAAMAWHWAWERHGAPQLESRFEKRAGRPMRDIDWAAWLAVKAVAEAVQRTASGEFAKVRDHLLSPDLVLDGFKGNRSNFRPWNRQLRQPILLGTHNWVTARAPLPQYLHQHDNLDTLGFDERESKCRL